MSNLFISLDFELKWGMLDSNEKYNKNILGARKAIPLILESFYKFKIKSTWAIVGILFNSDLDDFKKFKNNLINSKIRLNPYQVDLSDKKLHDLYFASDLVKMIINYNCHEIATHTYSHFDLSGKNDLSNEFREDIKMAKKIAYENII